MIILKIIMSFIIFLLIPELIGLLFTRFLKSDKNNKVLALIIGILIEFAICQILTVPMIYLKVSFKLLFYTYIGILGVL